MKTKALLFVLLLITLPTAAAANAQEESETTNPSASEGRPAVARFAPPTVFYVGSDTGGAGGIPGGGETSPLTMVVGPAWCELLWPDFCACVHSYFTCHVTNCNELCDTTP